MSNHQHVWVGAAVQIDSAPDNAREIIENLLGERLWQPCDGNEDRHPYLLPNIDSEKYGFTYCYDRDEAVISINFEEIGNAVQRLYDDYQTDFFRLSSAGFVMRVVYVALAYWL